MKKFSVAVAFVVSALVIGCQDNSQFNPISSDSRNIGTLAKKNSVSPDGIFEMKTQLKTADNTYDLVGEIQYTFVPGADDTYTFSLVTDATLESVESETGPGVVYGESIDPVFMGGKQIASYERQYSVNNPKDKELYLHVVFQLTPDEVQISKMWLSEPQPKGGFIDR